VVKAIIEIGDDKNRQVMFNPTQEILRGTWKQSNIPGTRMHESMASMPPVIPGIWLVVDTEAKIVSRIDPLLHNKELWDRIFSNLKENQVFLGLSRPWPNRTWENASDNQMKEWLYWFRRLVTPSGVPGEADYTGPKATIIGSESSLPSMDEIAKLPGKVRTETFSSYNVSSLYREDLTLPEIEKITNSNLSDYHSKTVAAIARMTGAIIGDDKPAAGTSLNDSEESEGNLDFGN
jgi:hypothetical protein